MLTTAPEPWLVAANPLTGEPQKGVSFSMRPWSRNSDFVEISGTTDTDGFLKAKPQKDGGNILAQRGNDCYGPDATVNGHYRQPLDERMEVNLVTPLSLYHPGDTVQWAAAAFIRAKGKSGYRIASGRKVSLTLCDANGQEQGQAVATTDEWGRAEGFFVLPAGGLQGQYRIMARYTGASGGNEFGGNVWFNVSRLPPSHIPCGGCGGACSPSR